MPRRPPTDSGSLCVWKAWFAPSAGAARSAKTAVLIYCNTGSLSAQSVFAMRLLGWENVKVLQDGFEGWKKKGGFEANTRAGKPAGH